MRYIKIFILIIVILVICTHLFLPSILRNYAEKTINKIPGYKVTIKNVDIHLYCGSYALKNIVLSKIKNKAPVPFFSAKVIDFSIEWRALFKGHLVAKIIAFHPVVNFVIDPIGNAQQENINSQWKEMVEKLFPLNINRLEVRNGEVHYRSFTSKPPFNLYVRKLKLLIENMQIAKSVPNKLSSKFIMAAESMRGGTIDIKGKFDPLAAFPTFYLTANLKDLKLADTNQYLDHLTALKVKEGIFSLFVEIAASNGKIKGYAKPFVKNLKIKNPNPANPLQDLYAGAVKFFTKVITNSQQKTIATKVLINGNIEDPDTSILSIAGYLISHAFIRTLIPQIDHSVETQDISYK